ncbi:MAG: ATP-binding cassette domain-containing protein [Acidobacteria bacterium]|nr:ATP-binding cassette domain-containing protein [Acidobacteriota bacterium]
MVSGLRIPASGEVIAFDDVELAFADKTVLSGVSFTLYTGETLALLGVTGSGKTVILKLALGLLRPDAGRIRVFGTDITELEEEELFPLRTRLGIVFQESALFDSLTVYENVAFRLLEERAHGDKDYTDEQIERRVREVLRFVELEAAIGKFPAELSGGMKRRVGIARALITEPAAILYDSPTGGLDPVTSHTINTLIIKSRDVSQVSSIVVTHRLQDAFTLANFYFDAERGGLQPAASDGRQHPTRTRFLLLRDGRIAFDGSPAEFKAQRDPYLRRFLP